MSSQPRIPLSFNLMGKPAGALCNLDCSYCYYKGKMLNEKYPHTVMQPDVLEAYIKQYIVSQATPVVIFSWQGGEPTLAGTSFFEEAIRLQQKYAGPKKIENTIQTNATLLDESWCRFFKRHQFLVGVSIDGPREIHDLCRRDIGQAGSWEKVMEGINRLIDHEVDFNTLTSVTCHSARYPLEIYTFLKELGSRYQQYAPVVERFAPKRSEGESDRLTNGLNKGAELTPWSVPAERYGDFLVAIFDKWVREDVGEIFIQLFETTLANWLGEDPGLCLFSKYCGNAQMVEKNGDLYSCDHFAFPEYRIGNMLERPLQELALSEAQIRFAYNKHNSLPAMCRECQFLFACWGECPKNRFCTTPDGEYGLNYLCAGLKKYFNHVAPFMDHMAEQIRNGKSLLSVREKQTDPLHNRVLNNQTSSS